MAQRDLLSLDPTVRRMAVAFLNECRACGLPVLIYCTLRSNAEQAALYAQGRTAPGPIVTKARAGESMHNPDALGYAWAFDAVPLMPDGAAAWSDDVRISQMGVCGEAVGLEWAGRWRSSLRERLHFQFTKGRKNA